MDPTEAAWNGELESLKAEPWWPALDADTRAAIVSGLRAKYGNWQSGMQRRMTDADTAKKGAGEAARAEVAAQIAEMEAKLEEALSKGAEHEKNAKTYSDFFVNDPDAIDPEAHKSLQSELEELRSKHAELLAEKAERDPKHAGLQAEFDAHKCSHDEYRAAVDDMLRAQGEAYADTYVTGHRDLIDDEDAREILCSLIDKGMDYDEAAAKVRRLKGLHAAAAQPVTVIAVEPKPKPAIPVIPQGEDPLEVMAGGDTAPGGFGSSMADKGVKGRDIRAAAERAVRLHSGKHKGI